MIDIPIGKALVPVEREESGCEICFLHDVYDCSYFCCAFCDRKDGKNVIFKLVDWPVKEKQK